MRPTSRSVSLCVHKDMQRPLALLLRLRFRCATGRCATTLGAPSGRASYMGWSHLATDRTDQKIDITITVDQDKIQEDKEKAKERIQDVGEKMKEKIAAPTDQGKEERRRP